MKAVISIATSIILIIGGTARPILSQQKTTSTLRAPATPLIVHDPYFSIWSTGNRITDGPTRHWTGVPQSLNGLVRVDGKTFRYLGNSDDDIPAMEESNRAITPTRTIVTLQSPQIELKLTFLTPAFPDDMAVMSRPVTYVTWDVKARDGATHSVALHLDAEGDTAINHPNEAVTWSRAEVEGLHLVRVGSSKQPILQDYGDDVRIN